MVHSLLHRRALLYDNCPNLSFCVIFPPSLHHVFGVTDLAVPTISFVLLISARSVIRVHLLFLCPDQALSDNVSSPFAWCSEAELIKVNVDIRCFNLADLWGLPSEVRDTAANSHLPFCILMACLFGFIFLFLSLLREACQVVNSCVTMADD